MVNGILAILIGYMLGSIPSAYIITRLKTGKDIRKLGGGNVGANNVYREVGLVAAIIVGFFDMAKGAIAVLIAGWLVGYPKPWLLSWLLPWDFDSSTLFILAAGLAAVVGHIWSIYLKFTGGNGIATTIGVLSILLTRELGVALAISLLLMVITHNLILSINISLLISVPVFAWFLQGAWLSVVFALILSLVLVVHFLPTALAALNKAGSKEKFTAELLRVETDKKNRKKKRT
jgi:glycerol-3-phosphate acyltransferase PlsY